MYRYKFVLPEELIYIVETHLWNSRKSLMTDADFLLNSYLVPIETQTSGSKQTNSDIILATMVLASFKAQLREHFQEAVFVAPFWTNLH